MAHPLFDAVDDDCRIFSGEPAEKCWNSHRATLVFETVKNILQKTFKGFRTQTSACNSKSVKLLFANKQLKQMRS